MSSPHASGRGKFVRSFSALAIACAGPVHGAPIFESYEAFYKSLPNPLFAAADEKLLGELQSFDGQAFRAWGAVPAEGRRRAAGEHRVELLGLDMTMDRHVLSAARATIFPGEAAAEIGSDARLFVGARDVCVQGVAPSSSGTAQRHVHVRLVTDAFTNRAHRYDLPALFNSCLALYRGPRGSVRFFEASYRTRIGAALADGLVLRRWALQHGRFAPRGRPLRIEFPDPEDVYRFRVVGQ